MTEPEIVFVRQQRKTAVFITQSINEALSMGERILVFAPPGHVVEDLVVPKQDDAEGLLTCQNKIMAAMGQAAPAETADAAR
jgi:ABC-type nitrate/sulfonate/bicarbonate transport system ATPase subunit